MPSMVRVGNLGSRWGPPGAFGGPQTGSNTCAEHERKRAIKRKRPFTLPRHLEALLRLRQGFPPHSGHMWKAQRRRRKPCQGALGAPGGHSGAPRTVRLPFVSVGLSTWNNWLKVAPKVTLEVSDCRVW